MASIAEIRKRVTSRIQDSARSLDAAGLTQNIDSAITSSLEEFSKARPLEIVEEIDGNGTFKVKLTGTSPAVNYYSAGLSEILSVVYPYVATDAIRTELEDFDFEIRRLPDGLYLCFPTATPTASEKILVEYTGRHRATSSELTVDESDWEAVADLAAHHAFLSLAAQYVQSVQPDISADAVNRSTKPDLYRSLARSFREAYDKKMASGTATGAASVLVDLDRPSSDGRDYLVHDRRRF